MVAHDKLKGSKAHNPEPTAAEMYRMFHGADADETVEYITEEHEHSVLWGLGDLVEMTVVTIHNKEHTIGVGPHQPAQRYPDPSALPVAERVVLAASEDGRQLIWCPATSRSICAAGIHEKTYAIRW